MRKGLEERHDEHGGSAANCDRNQPYVERCGPSSAMHVVVPLHLERPSGDGVIA